MADQRCIPPRDSTGRFVRVHGDPPPAPQPSPIQLASNQLQPVAAVVQEAANESRIFTQRAAHHHATPQPVEDKLEESETEGLIGTPEIIRPSLETFVQLPLPSAQASIIPPLSPRQGQAPPYPTPQPSTPQISPLMATAATNADEMVQHLLCTLVMLGQSTPQNPPLQAPAPVPPTQTRTHAPNMFDGSNP